MTPVSMLYQVVQPNSGEQSFRWLKFGKEGSKCKLSYKKVSFESKQSTMVIPRENNYLFFFSEGRLGLFRLKWRVDSARWKNCSKVLKEWILQSGANHGWWKKHFLGCIYTCTDVDTDLQMRSSISDGICHLYFSVWKARLLVLKLRGIWFPQVAGKKIIYKQIPNK